jgi:hypothetical protein
MRRGHAAAVLMESLYGTSTLNNAATGVISVAGTDGYAFAVLGSDAVDTINNNGRITGALALYGGNDVFNNRSGGVWSTGGTHSTDFGDGNDTLNNLAGGLVDILTGAITFGAGNDTLANAGTVRTGTGGTISFGDGNDTLSNASRWPGRRGRRHGGDGGRQRHHHQPRHVPPDRRHGDDGRRHQRLHQHQPPQGAGATARWTWARPAP